MVVITGAAGFIGSCLIGFLNEQGITDIVAVDRFRNPEKKPNLEGKDVAEQVEREAFHDWLSKHHSRVNFVFHLGARTDTGETNPEIFERLNTGYSQKLWTLCALCAIPLLYASSAATYGMGDQGFDDSHALIPSLKPLNLYGKSKNDFDKWALVQQQQPPFWAGIKFFNVYGPNEYHKGRMASVIFHAYHQAKKTGMIKLFRSHRADYKDGEQVRDFVYVKDVMEILYHFFTQKPASGIYNAGTGQARTFNDLAKAVFNALGKKANIEYVDTPADIRESYQYFTEAKISRLRNTGYIEPFTSLEKGVEDYVRNYLIEEKYL